MASAHRLTFQGPYMRGKIKCHQGFANGCGYGLRHMEREAILSGSNLTLRNAPSICSSPSSRPP
jgi:hypothetical protein